MVGHAIARLSRAFRRTPSIDAGLDSIDAEELTEVPGMPGFRRSGWSGAASVAPPASDAIEAGHGPAGAHSGPPSAF